MIKPVAGLGIGITSTLLNNWSMALFNIPVTVIGMAAAGSILSFAYEPEGAPAPMSRKKLYFLAVANTIFAAASVSILPDWLGWKWLSNAGMEGSFALLLAAGARFLIPVLITMPKELLSKWFGVGKYYKGKTDVADYNPELMGHKLNDNENNNEESSS